MKRISSGTLAYSPTDLTRFFESEFASWMDHYYQVAGNEGPLSGVHKNPPDPLQALLAEKGNLHEDKVLKKLRENDRVVTIERKDGDTSSRIEATLSAMKTGEPYIYQAALKGDTFFGYADLLRKVPGKSTLGDFHYEPLDMKIALAPKPTAVLQLCAYADALNDIQGRLPELIAVITRDGETHTYRTGRFFAFYRAFKRRFMEFHVGFDPTKQPLPLKGDDHRDWSIYAKRTLHERDDIQLTARIRQDQVDRLREAGIQTMNDLAHIDPASRPGELSEDALRVLAHQAQLQLKSPRDGTPAFDVLEHPSGVRFGLSMLPDPHPKDFFFDMEGYPLLGANGLEYLYGAAERGPGKTRYHETWAKALSEEGKAFESFITSTYTRWKENPGLHIYHYGHYEPSTLKRLMGQYGVGERMMDELLRNEVFVDLYQVVGQGLRVGTHSYGLKAIERLYYPKRETEVGSGAESAVEFANFLESHDEQFLDRIRAYNQDDCYSAKDLESFLRKLKDERKIAFVPLQKDPEVAERTPDPDSAKERCSRKAEELLGGIPIERRGRPFGEADPADYLRELLAHMLDFHRREDNPDWWDYFRRRDLTPEQLYDEVSALAGVRIAGTNADGHLKCTFDPEQETKFRSGEEVLILENEAPFEKLVIEDWNVLKGELTLSGDPARMPSGAFTLAPAKSNIRKDALLLALLNTADGFSTQAKDFGLRRAVHDLLLKRPPQIGGRADGAPLVAGKKSLVEEITDVVLGMNGACLCIQGPPGAGKTYTGSRVIGALLKQGKSVAISSNGHKAISNLLKGVDEVCGADRSICRPVKLASGDRVKKETQEYSDSKVPVKSSSTSLNVLFGDSKKPLHPTGPVNVVGATAFYLCKDDLLDRFDYLFVDEATQVCLPNLVAMARCAKNIVLMGDQMQLDQPTQATHPGDSGSSALVHLTDGQSVIDPSKGVFLPETHRMHPAVNSVVSELFYEGLLRAHPTNETQKIVWAPDVGTDLPPHGIHFQPVAHTGNTHGSEEEAVEIKRIVALALKSRWHDKKGNSNPFALKDILIVAPYNYQVSLIKEHLGMEDVRVGSVDLFQGQEAPLVILSLCASTTKDAPRGISFLLNRNRINVALSRAQALAVVVGSPMLATGKVSTIQGMELLNSICRVSGECPDGGGR